jgi:glutamyl-tRNA synthetase
MTMAEPRHPEEALAKEHLGEAGRATLKEVAPRLRALADWTAPAISASLKETVAALKVKMPQVMMPFRVALTGQAQTPAIDAIAAALRREVAIARIERAIAA